MKKKIIFLDRDGTLTVETAAGYVHRLEDFAFTERALVGLQALQQQGFGLCITTSQSGIGRGYYREEDFHRFNAHLLEQLAAASIAIDYIFFCPHHPIKGLGKYQIDCLCRKPKIGMISQAIDVYRQRGIDLDLAHSFVIGDKTDDGEMGNRAGCRSILVQTASGKQGRDGHYLCRWDYIALDLYDAALWIAQNPRN